MEHRDVLFANNLDLNRNFNVKYGLPKNPHNYSWQCNHCKKPLYYNQYENCFKHRGQKPEGFEPETVEHKAMKHYWYNIFPKFNPIKLREQEFWLGDQIADVYFELYDGKKVAIECQNSPVTSKKLIDRTKKYTEKGIYVLWVFIGTGTCVSEEKNTCNKDKARVLGVEKRVHNLYAGRIYYMNVVGDEVIEEPYAIHFSPYFKHKLLDTNIYGCDKYYKEFQNVVFGKLPTLKILCVDYKKYKLARFMDKSMSISCTEVLLTCLRELCLKKVNEGNLDSTFEFKVDVDSVIDAVQEEFGYFLPYLILKRSKRIKKCKFEKLLDENYRVRDMLTLKTTDYL